MRYKTSEYRLGDIATMKYGKMPEKNKKRDFGYPIFTGYKIAGYYDEYMYKDPKLIVVARGVGTGDVKLSPPYSYITNLSIIIELNEEIADKYYMKLYLDSLNLRYLDSGSAQSQITINDLKNLRINIPELKIQKRISHTIYLLEDKIELNNQIIANLEQIAQTLFKHWFIDFEFPNENGEPYKSSGGKMVQSELGEIPEGWEVALTSDLGSFKNGVNYNRTSTGNTKYEIYNVRNVVGNRFFIQGDIEKIFLDKDKAQNYTLEKGDILIVRSANPGETVYINNSNYNSVFSGFIIRFRPIKKYLSTYMFFYFYMMKELLDSFSTGTTLKNLNQQLLKSQKVIIPSKNLIQKFHIQVQQIFDLVQLLDNENKNLQALRDTLLPKLLSGEIELPDEIEVTENVLV